MRCCMIPSQKQLLTPTFNQEYNFPWSLGKAGPGKFICVVQFSSIKKGFEENKDAWMMITIKTADSSLTF